MPSPKQRRLKKLRRRKLREAPVAPLEQLPKEPAPKPKPKKKKLFFTKKHSS